MQIGENTIDATDGSPEEAEDIFAEVDKSEFFTPLKQAVEKGSQETGRGNNYAPFKKIIIAVGLLIAVVLFFFGTWYVYINIFKKSNPADSGIFGVKKGTVRDDPAGNGSVEKPGESGGSDKIAAETKDEIFDEDKDGLNVLEEKKYGSDPKDPDTDKDGYLDGAEVHSGYNPLGPGKLR
jgi:hypothetical protein